MIYFVGGQYRQYGTVRLRCKNQFTKHLKCSGTLKFQDLQVSVRRNMIRLGTLLDVQPHDSW